MVNQSLVPAASKVTPLTPNRNDVLTVTNVDTNQPLELASKFVDASLLRDKITPVLEDSIFHGKAVDYNFSNDVDGLGALTPFVKQELINIPDEILSQYNKVQTVGSMGIFPEINRAWVVIDNKLILWNLTRTSEFQSFEDIPHTILKVELVKPKPNTFTEAINYLLLISTPSDIHILALSFANNSLDLYNTHMSVPAQGLSADHFVVYEKTGQVFFTGASDGLNIWELQYSNSADWFNKKCNKRCLTRSTVSSLIPGSSLINSFLGNEQHNEVVTQVKIDNSRGIIYTLTNKSYIRAYKITAKGSIDSSPALLQPYHISSFARTSSAKSSPLLHGKYLQIVSISVVTALESNDLYLVAVTVGGCRLYLNGSCNASTVSELRLESVKFPPTKVTEEEIAIERTKYNEQEATRSSTLYGGLAKDHKELPTKLSYQKKSGVLHKSLSASTMISPGIFFDVVEKEGQSDNKLFVSVPDYGVLKYHERSTENATFLEVQGKIHQIVPLSPPFNATDRPRGYANEFATQYTKGSFEVAVLTNSSLVVYSYRTPDQVFESMTDDLTPFVTRYGFLEAASTALYVTCKFSLPKTIRANAFNFFTVGIPNVVDFKPSYKKIASTGSMVTSVLTIANNSKSDETFSFQNVTLSPRFYGIVTLLGRLFRDVWEKNVFQISKDIKYNKDNTIVKTSIFENEFLASVNITQSELEFFLSSISVLNEFFQTYGNTIACFVPPSFNNRNFDKSEEFCNQAENIAINSVIRLVISMKEALSFLVVLIKEDTDDTDAAGDRLRGVFKYLSLDVQQSLSKLTFKDIFAPNDNTKNLIKEILSSIINRSMSRGESIEYIAKGLQERCGTFCSANDVVGFRAIEHLRKAKEIGFKDYDGLNYHLSRAIELFEAINNEISLEKLKESIDIMVGLNDFPRAIKFALNISASIDQGNLAAQYSADGKLANDERKKYYEKRRDIFEIVFQLLVQVDKLALESSVNQEQEQDATRLFDSSLSPVTDFAQLRNLSYDTAFKFEDKLFHYELYDWFISQEVSERLLEIDTPYVLGYLEEKAAGSLEISDMLWIYQSKKENHYQAALISYNLALSDFAITLSQRNEYLSRAIGFCNCTRYPTERQQVIQLSTMIEEVFEASNIQYDLLIAISNDKILSDEQKIELIDQLDGKILTVSELFNDFANVLSYHEICLHIFKASDFRNSEEILSRWDQLFENVKQTIYTDSGLQLTNSEDDVILNGTTAEKYVSLLSATIIKIGKKLSSSEFVFPVSDLLPIVTSLIYDLDDADSFVSKGAIASIFLECGITFDKLYYLLKGIVDTNGNDANVQHYKDELVFVIKKWYDEDRRLREIIDNDAVRNLTVYTSQGDPIANYMSRTGNSV